MFPATLKHCGLVLATAILIAGCNRKQAAAPQTAGDQGAPVQAAAAITRDVPMYLEAIGTTVPIESVAIVPQVGGRVMAAHVEDGAYITKGQLLFEIDPRPFEAAFAAAQATLAQGQAELAWAQADFKRTEELVATQVASQLEYEQKKSVLGVDQAKIDSAKAAIETAKLNLEYAKIYSPISGRGGAVLVDAGNVVRANEGTLLTIQQLDPIYAEFTVTENDLGTVRKFMSARGIEIGNEPRLGLKAEVDVPGDSSRVLTALSGFGPSTQPQADRSGPRDGTLTFLDNTIQSRTGTVKLRATVPNSDRYFWPGQFVNVRLVLTTKKNAVLIPAEAQQFGQQGPYVYVVTKEQTAEQRPITPGQRQGELLVVERGVDAGEKVVVSGHMMVRPGGKVMVTNEPAPAQTAQR